MKTRKKQIPFKLYGGNEEACDDTTSRELLVAGPSGSGKTFANLWKLREFGLQHPRARMLIVRKTRHSLTETALVTWERDVLADTMGRRILGKPIDRGHRHSYKFPNGSVLVTGGMDKPDKVLSSEWDLIYVNEATDLTLADWETLGGRLRAMAGSYDQLFGDCNPTSPHHWLYKRCISGGCRLLKSRHYENPRYYNPETGEWTEAGQRYIFGRLEKFTGARRARFLHGEWVAAEGLVYAYDHTRHQLPSDWTPDPHWRRVWGIDWGDRAPTVLQIWAVDGDGRMYLTREVFKCHLRADELGRWAKAEIDSGREPRPYACICDHDPDKAQLFTLASGVRADPADKADRDRGIQQTQARFDDAEDGKPRVFFREGAREHAADLTLIGEGRPTSTVEELCGYIWDPKFLKDEPIAENDHGCDVLRYVCRFVDSRLSPGSGGEYTVSPQKQGLPNWFGGKVGSATGW